MRDLADLRVCFVAGTLGQGGAERQLFHIVSTLKQERAVVTVLSFSQGEFWEERLRALGVPVHYIGGSRFKVVRLARILKFARRCRPAVLQSCHFHVNLYVAAAGRAAGIREVGALRSDAVTEVRRVGGRFGRWSLSVPRLIAANSGYAIANAVKLGAEPRRLCLLPNVLDCSHYCPAARSSPDTARLLWVGRLAPEKRPDRFLAVLAGLKKQLPQALSALIVGNGPLRAQLEHQASGLGLLPGTVEFLGAVPDAKSAYLRSQVLVLTSDREGLPNVILEAMACGLPVVATAVGAVAELIRPGETGFTIERDDECQMIGALLRLITDARLRESMGRQARSLVESKHSLGSLEGHLRSLYSRAIE